MGPDWATNEGRDLAELHERLMYDFKPLVAFLRRVVATDDVGTRHPGRVKYII